ncbi:MAG: ABC transporter permease [Candidatus Omnitrophica bacterium]|nr:ABC transporter permease [Candidatus Omnitrophota bacterium]
MKKIIAFLKKTFLVESSYQFPLALNIASIFLGLLSYFFINKLFGQKITTHLELFGVDYFSYVLVSTGLFGYISVGINSFPQKIADEQMEGTLEAIILTPTKTKIILAGLGIWNFIVASVDFAIYAILGLFVFRVNLGSANLASVALVLILSILSFTGLGIISASFVVIFKRGNPLAWVIGAFEGIVGGIFFPISVLPGWLQIISMLFPVTYAVKAMELAVYRGYTIYQLKTELTILVIFSTVLLPTGIKFFGWAINYAKKQGTLASY